MEVTHRSELLGVSEVTFFVSDVNEVVWWIEDLTGQKPIFISENFVMFKIGQTNLGIHSADDKVKLGASGNVAYWEVKDIDSAIVDFLSLGGCLYRSPIVGADGARVCQVMDLFGNVWGLREASLS